MVQKEDTQEKNLSCMSQGQMNISIYYIQPLLLHLLLFSSCVKREFLPVVPGFHQQSSQGLPVLLLTMSSEINGLASLYSPQFSIWPSDYSAPGWAISIKIVPTGLDDKSQPKEFVHVHSPFLLLLYIIGKITCHPTEIILKI